MNVAFGIFVALVGAIIRFGFTGEVSGVDLDVIGTILMVGGGAIALLSLLYLGLNSSAYEEEKFVPTKKKVVKKKVVKEDDDY